MVWYNARNESLNGADLSENCRREIRELIQGILPKRRVEKSGNGGVEWLEAEVGPREVCFCCCCSVFFFKMDEIIAHPYVDDSDPVEGKQWCRRERGDN